MLLVSVSNNHKVDEMLRKVFLWVLWKIWMAHNSLSFTKLHIDPFRVASETFEDVELWKTSQCSVVETEPQPTGQR